MCGVKLMNEFIFFTEIILALGCVVLAKRFLGELSLSYGSPLPWFWHSVHMNLVIRTPMRGTPTMTHAMRT